MSSRRPLFSLPSRSASRMRADLDEELSFHHDMRVADLMALGHSQHDAERIAASEMAATVAARGAIMREDRGSELGLRLRRLANEFWQDMTHALRGLRRAPGMTLLVTFTLALGLGANIAILAAVRSVLLAPLPYAESERLVSFYRTSLDAADQESSIAPGSWQSYQELDAFSGIGAWMQGGRTIPGPDGPVPLETAFVSANMFDLLGTRMHLGRGFRAGEDSTTAAGVTVLSNPAWVTHFGGDSSVIGRALTLGSQPTIIVGVLPRGFALPGGSHAIYTTLQVDALLSDPDLAQKRRFLRLVGRLSDGVTPELAAAELRGAAAREASDWPEAHAGFTAGIRPVRETVSGGVRTPLLVLLGASALVLLIACANVAGVLVARTIARRRELAVRAALGAGRGRLTRQLLVESAVLAALGGAAGLAVAFAAAAGLRVVASGMLPPETTIALDGRTILASLGLVLLSGLLFGVLPALTAAGGGLRSSLTSGRGDTPGKSRQRVRTALVMLQTAIAVVLLVGAGLLTRTLVALNEVDMGYQVEGVLVFRVSPPFSRYPNAEAQAGFFDELHTRLARLPGVQAVGHTGIAPLNGAPTSSLAIEGKPVEGPRLPEVNLGVVSDDYFAAMRIPLLEGRVFERRDVEAAPGVVLVNEALALRYFPDGDAVGSRIRLGPDESAAWRTIVGVVGDTREAGADAPAAPMAYESTRQLPWGTAEMMVRTAGDPMSLVPAARGIVRDMDDQLPLLGVRALSDVLSGTLAPRRTPMMLLLAFAGIALALAAVGLYGVTAYSVAARTREIGVRVALGAERGRVLGLVLRQGLMTTLPGLLIGLAGAVFLSRLLKLLLYGVKPLDVTTYAAVALLLLAVSLLAIIVPARRALRVDPVVALRTE